MSAFPGGSTKRRAALGPAPAARYAQDVTDGIQRLAVSPDTSGVVFAASAWFHHKERFGVMSLTKVQFGCGANRLDGWQNYDLEVDITTTLPFEDESVDYIFCEHCIEHVSQREGFLFMEECKRILVPGGVVRLATPDIDKLAHCETDTYRTFLKAHGWGDGKPGCGVRAILFNHGHQHVYSKETMRSMLYGSGFKHITFYEPGDSRNIHLKDVECHGRVIGDEFNRLETFCAEASKPHDAK